MMRTLARTTTMGALARTALALALATATAVAAAGCQWGSGAKPAPAATGRAVEIVPASAEGEVAPLVQRELTRARGDGKQLLVYVGATWCEPCKRFHQAAAEGKLNGEFPTLRLLEFDSDRDNERLAVAGYFSRFIPMFARPNGDGRASGKQIEGSVKGDAAVTELVPKLRGLMVP
jgi:thiol-disulfide isomerase/thioredoxin